MGDQVENVMPTCHNWNDNRWGEAHDLWSASQRLTRGRGISSVQVGQLDDYVDDLQEAAVKLGSFIFLEDYTMDVLCFRPAVELSHRFPEVCNVVERPSPEALNAWVAFEKEQTAKLVASQVADVCGRPVVNAVWSVEADTGVEGTLPAVTAQTVHAGSTIKPDETRTTKGTGEGRST